jgi:hypothetical protein
VSNGNGEKILREGAPIGSVGPGLRPLSSGHKGSVVLVSLGGLAGSLVIPPFVGRAVGILFACVSYSLSYVRQQNIPL